MANLGLLGGLGDALQVFGGAWSAKKKSELADQLEKEREERAEARAIAREERQRKRDESATDTFRIERDADGATWRQGYNKFGQRTGERELASAQDIKDYNFEDKKRQVSLDKLVNDAQYAKEKHEADIKYRGALTEAADARAYRSMNPVPRTSSGRSGSSRTSLDEVDGPVNESDLAQAMIAEYPALFKDTGLTTQETFDYALESIRIAQKQGKDPVLVARGAVQKYLDRKKKGTGTKPGQVKLGTPPR